MTVSVVLAVVLGLALLAAVMALIWVELNSSTSTRRRPGPGVVGHAALAHVDLGLRTLSAVCARAGRDLPDFYAVVCSEDRIGLRLAGPDAAAPQPWEADESGDQWSVARKAFAGGSPAMGSGTTAGESDPCPLTVTVGFHDGDRVLIDLARSSTPIALTGEPNDVRRLARSLVLEVVTGPVGRGAEVTLVGSAAELADEIGVGSARLRTAATLEEAFDGVGRSPDAGFAFTASSVTSVFRVIEGSNPPAGRYHAPQLVVVDAAQLRQGPSPLPGVGQPGALLVLGDTENAGWRFEVGADGSLDTGALGLPIDTHAAYLG